MTMKLIVMPSFMTVEIGCQQFVFSHQYCIRVQNQYTECKYCWGGTLLTKSGLIHINEKNIYFIKITLVMKRNH